jgi:hypothetical protein
VADDLPAAVDDQGSLANYVAVPLTYGLPGQTQPPQVTGAGANTTISPPLAQPQPQRKVIPGQSFWSADSSADGEDGGSSAVGTAHAHHHHHTTSDGKAHAGSAAAYIQANWTSEFPPELIEAAREEEAYLAASAGQYDSAGGHTARVTGFVPAPNIPPAPGLPRHLDKLILNSRVGEQKAAQAQVGGSSAGGTPTSAAAAAGGVGGVGASGIGSGQGGGRRERREREERRERDKERERERERGGGGERGSRRNRAHVPPPPPPSETGEVDPEPSFVPPPPVAAPTPAPATTTTGDVVPAGFADASAAVEAGEAAAVASALAKSNAAAAPMSSSLPNPTLGGMPSSSSASEGSGSGPGTGASEERVNGASGGSGAASGATTGATSSPQGSTPATPILPTSPTRSPPNGSVRPSTSGGATSSSASYHPHPPALDRAPVSGSRTITIDTANMPAMTDDGSVLPVPSHVVLHHLCTSAIKNQVLAVANTTRYRKKVGFLNVFFFFVFSFVVDLS